MTSIFIFTYIACGVLGHGILLAQCHREWPSIVANSLRADFLVSLFLGGLLGPFGLFSALLMAALNGQWHGLKFSPRLDPDWPEQNYRYWASHDWCPPDYAKKIANEEAAKHGFVWEEPHRTTAPWGRT